MANVKFDRKSFEREIGKLDEVMQEKIALFGTPVEKIDQDIVELEIFPNRPDLLGYHGFKRSFLSFLGNKTGLKIYKLNKPEKNYEVKVDPSVKDVRPFTACAIVKGLKFDDSKIKEIVEIQEKLHATIGRQRKKLAIGIYPLEEISLPITYKALEPDKIKFKPLESPREMSGLEILQKHPTGKDYAHLLTGKMKFPIFIDNDENILSMPPIINSEKTGRVTSRTKDVFIECSGFDFEILKKCLNIIVTNLAEMGGKIYQMKVKDKITPDFEPEKMSISIERANGLLGLDLNEKEMKVCLEKMGYDYKNGQVEIPSWRMDILHEVDLIEDIAIAYGYDNFNPIIPEISTTGSENKRETLKKKFAELLIGLGLLELSSYHLAKKDDQLINMGFSEKDNIRFVELEESKTDYNIMRKELSPSLLKIISENSDSEYPQKIFELGRVFYFDEEKKIIEKEKLCSLLAPGNFTDLKQILDYLFLNIGLEFKIEEEENQSFVEGRVGKIIFEGKKIGIIGEIHPKILRNWKIKVPISLFEIDLEKLFEKF
ncbi:phenylalanine--tRNA ligase subunit beta [Candidatus Pacearchaeota archaeon CG10_big_fil_rev_8_21_14_0_10_32_42]|nr:MAG: phenylalanine--tRNA ligase subunit beta [Candidatus Pacearchaeota archaeon CG10_big_fil_rev_8_21_14_0_10_32_42]